MARFKPNLFSNSQTLIFLYFNPSLSIIYHISGSALIYSYATLRSIVRDHEVTLNPNADKDEVVAFDSPELIITQSSGKTAAMNGANLKYSIDANDILKFIRLNRPYLTDKSGSLEFNPKVRGKRS